MKIAWNQTHPDQALILTDLDSLNQEHPELLKRTDLLQQQHPIRFCKIMQFQQELSGTFVIPQKEHPINDRMSFAFILYGETLYFIGDLKELKPCLDLFMKEFDGNAESPFMFLLRFMNFLIQEDIYFLEEYNEKMQAIEEHIYEGPDSGMERFIMTARKDMNILGNYYLQLTAVGQTMQQTIIPQNQQDENAMVSLFLSRCSQLLAMVDEIKDYTSQIWNLRQTQLSDKQNKISTLLTVISTIFLPLTFLTGWYGMNFTDMPLVKMRYGYLILICVVVLIVLAEIRFIHRRHWLSVSRDFQESKKEAKKHERKY